MGQTLQGNAGRNGGWRRAAAACRAGLIFLGLLLPPDVRGQDSLATLVQVGEVTVLSWPDESRLALALADLADRPAEWTGLGRRSAGRLRLVVVPDAAAMRRMSGGRAPAWGAGLAFPGSRTIIIRADAGDPRQTLRHELAHLVFHDTIKVRVPLWFDEGYAAVAAHEWDRMDAFRLSWIALRRELPGFREVDGGLRGRPGEAEEAYTLAMSAVVELGKRNPAQSLDSLLASLARGVGFEDAVLASTGLPIGVFESDWQRTIKREYNFVIWLSAGGFWLVVTLIVGAAWWFRRRYDRPRRLALDQGWVIPEDTPPGNPGEPVSSRGDESAPES